MPALMRRNLGFRDILRARPGPAGLDPNQPGGTGEQNLAEDFSARFKDDPFYDSEGFKSILSRFNADPERHIQTRETGGTWADAIKGYGNTFSQIFKNYVGRDPNKDEYSQFFSSVILPQWNQLFNPDVLRQTTSGLVQQYYSRTAGEEALRRAEDQTKLAEEKQAGQITNYEAQARPLIDAFRRQGDEAIGRYEKSYGEALTGVEKSLEDYQKRLFEKLRPQLLTSLQSQGLLNSGALNQAFAGAAGDLGAEGARYMQGLRSSAAQEVSNQRLANEMESLSLPRQITSARALGDLSTELEQRQLPFRLRQQTTLNEIPGLTQSGQSALSNVWSHVMQQQAFDNQKRLLEMQRPERSSPLSQYGGLILGGLAGGFGQSLGGGMAGRLPGAFRDDPGYGTNINYGRNY